MNPNPNLSLLVPLLLFGEDRQRMAAIFRQSLLPMSIGPWVAALVADRELRQQDEKEKNIIQEIITADNLVDPDSLQNKSKTLREVYDTLPEVVRNGIKFVSVT